MCSPGVVLRLQEMIKWKYYTNTVNYERHMCPGMFQALAKPLRPSMPRWRIHHSGQGLKLLLMH